MNPPTGASRSWLPLLVALLLVLLTLAAIFWPDREAPAGDGTLLVLQPEANVRRDEALAALTDYLAEETDVDLQLRVVRDRTSWLAALDVATVVVLPDAEASRLSLESWQPLAAGRRRVPWNLRPTAVLLSRVGAPATERPWREAPTRTAFGDSLSLVCLAPLCDDGIVPRQLTGVAWGADPYDHAGVIEAAKYGAFDHVVVRQWDARMALASGRLDPDQWRLTPLSGPMPDIVVMVRRTTPMATRLALQRAFTVLGRELDTRPQATEVVVRGLGLLGLDGFNLLLGPDFDRLRRRYAPCWLSSAE